MSNAQQDQDPSVLVVVVPARNEADRVAESLGSLARQDVPLRVMFSDNASEDGTPDLAAAFTDRLDLTVRTTALLGPSEHFVSAGRWALATFPGDDVAFALLAGDDAWSEGFARAVLSALEQHPEVGVVFPAFVWQNGARETRRLPPVDFRHADPAARQRQCLRLPDGCELSNLVYGVYRRAAFEDLLSAWEAGGDAFAADYAAVWSVLGSHRVIACPNAQGRRIERVGADLIERAGVTRPGSGNLLAQAVLYVRLNARINNLIAMALQRVAATDAASAPSRARVQALRAPQWLLGSVAQARGLARRGRGER